MGTRRSRVFNAYVLLVPPLVCFVYLTFIPGIILLGVLKLHSIDASEVIVSSVGLSLSVLIFSQAQHRPHIGPGFNRTIAIEPIVVAICLMLALRAISAFGRGSFEQDFLHTSGLGSAFALFLRLLTFREIFVLT